MTPDGQQLVERDDGANHHCANCGAQVTPKYVDVFAPEEYAEKNQVRACPRCPMVRERGGVREARSAGSGGSRTHEARPGSAGRTNSGYERRGETDGSA